LGAKRGLGQRGLEARFFTLVNFFTTPERFEARKNYLGGKTFLRLKGISRTFFLGKPSLGVNPLHLIINLEEREFGKGVVNGHHINRGGS